MRRLRLPTALAGLTALAAALALLPPAAADQLVREGFEGPDPLWVKGPIDGTANEIAHRISDERPFRGQHCEFIQVNVTNGNYVHYTFNIGRALVNDDLKASLYIRANRPGIQLLARVVLPHEANPDRLDDRLTLLIRGESSTLSGRWQQLSLSQVQNGQVKAPTKLLRDQLTLLRAQLKRDVNSADAYIDQLILNVNGGPGDNQVWIDNLEIGPVQDATPFQPASRTVPPRGSPTLPVPAARGPGIVELKNERLLVEGRPLFFRLIRWSDTPLDVLKDAGFNALCFDAAAKPEIIKEAAAKHFYVVPSIPLVGDREADALDSTVRRFTANDNVLFWSVGGGGLASEQAQQAGAVASLIRGTDQQHPIGMDVWDGFQMFRTSAPGALVGMHRWPLMTSLELGQYRDWLKQRRNLSQKDGFSWTWVQTHLPDWYTELVYDRPGAGAAFKEPIGPQPEQIRLLTYIAVGSGCRGLGFWSDRFLADSHTGQDRLLTLALLNKELDILEPLLMTSTQPEWIETSVSQVKAAVFRPSPQVGQGVVILPIWLGGGSQFVPAQGAVNDLKITLPLPQSFQVWQVTPGVVRPVDGLARVPGGIEILIKEFDLTTAIVCTCDVNLIVQLQMAERNNRMIAAQWSHDLAVAELKKVRAVHEQLDQVGHRLPDGAGLLARCEKSLQKTEDLWDAHRYGEAYLEAQRALRPLRILQRTAWEKATQDMYVDGNKDDDSSTVRTTRAQAPDTAPITPSVGTDPLKGPIPDGGRQPAPLPASKNNTLETPVSSPYAVSFYTLPRHWAFMEQLRAAKPGANVLPGGDFEAPPTEGWASPWLSQSVTLDAVELSADRVAEGPREGKQCLRLRIKAKDPLMAPLALERTFLAIHTPAVRLEPGTLVRISGWVRIPPPGIVASTDGALVYDSAGGEPLAIRLSSPIPKWKQFLLYRKVPASGTINVTLAMTGIGSAYFDDVRIEPMQTAR